MEALREFKFISRKFVKPHISSTVTWARRDSVVLREKIESGLFAYGEIAPVPEFPNQSNINDIIQDAEKWVHNHDLNPPSSLLPALSCMESGIWDDIDSSKCKKIGNSIISTSNIVSSSKTLKRKIGIFPIAEEIKGVKRWLSGLPDYCVVRLDANGSLSIDDLKRWIDEMSGESSIQYIEQPLKDALRDELFALAEDSQVPLAIDETIVAMGDPYFAADAGWGGFYIIKPTLLKDWSKTIKFTKANPRKTVFSTVFESPFGYEALLRVCHYSKLDAGLTREPFKNLLSELACHHKMDLLAPAATQSDLNELWSEF